MCVHFITLNNFHCKTFMIISRSPLSSLLLKLNLLPSPVFIFLTFFCLIFSNATSSIAQEIPLDIFSTDNGLIQNEVYSSFQDSRGYIWIGTYEGISRFNGRDFITYNNHNSGLGGNIVKSITEDTENRIWVAYNGGIGILEDDKIFKNITPEDGLLGHDVLSLWADLKGGIWAVTNLGVNYIFEGSIKVYPIKNINLNYYSLISGDANGNIYVALTNGIAIKSSSSETFIPLPEIKESVNAIDANIFGNYVYFITKNTLYRVDPLQKVEKLAVSPFSNSLIGLQLLSEQQVWICTDQEIWQWNEHKPDLNLNHTQLNEVAISGLLIDHNNDLWLNTWNGFIKIKDFNIKTFKTINSDTTAITSIQRYKGGYWIGTSKSMIHLSSDFKIKKKIPSHYINDLLILNSKTLLVATDFSLNLYSIEGELLKTIEESANFSALHKSSTGKIWVSKYDGLYSLKNDGLTFEIDMSSGMGSNTIWSFYEDQYGNLWSGTENGLSVLKPIGVWRHFTKKDNLPFKSVWSFAETPEWGLLIATEKGIYRYNKNFFTPLSFEGAFLSEQLKEQLNNETANLIRIDKNENLWLGNRFGLFQINKNRVVTHHLNKRSGLPTCGITLAGTFLSNKELLVGTYKGLALVKTDIKKSKSARSYVDINSVSINGKEASLNIFDQPLENSQNNIIFHFDSIYLKSPDDIQYSYKLENFDENWSIPSKTPKAAYTNLSYGNYTFQVKAIENPTQHSEIQPVSFSIQRPWWMQWWALLLEVILCIATFIIISNALTRRQVQKVQEEKKRLDEENLRLEHLVRQRTEALELEVRKKNKVSAKLRRNLQEIQNDLNLAKQLQQAVFPKIGEISFLKIAYLFIPYSEVSGDMYDLHYNREKEVNFFIGDATGHGVSAAMMTMMLQIILDSVRQDLPPHKMASAANSVLSAQNTGMYVTGILIRFTPQGQILFSNAGHPQLLIQRGKELITFDKRGLPLGLFEEDISSYQLVEFNLRIGDRVFVYTDGILEWNNAEQEQFGKKRLITYLETHYQLNITDVVSHLHEHLRRFAKTERCNDDITFFAIEYTGEQPD